MSRNHELAQAPEEAGGRRHEVREEEGEVQFSINVVNATC